MLVINNKALKISNKWLNPIATPEPTPPTPPTPTFDEVTIGTQTWMASNLAIDDVGEGIKSFNVGVDGVDLGTQYFYTWDAAVRIATSIQGWHLPSKTELETLFTTVGGTSTAGKKLKSTNGGWGEFGGTDDYGFTALAAGYNISGLGGEGNFATFWTDTEYDSSQSYACRLQRVDEGYIFNSNKTTGMSIRLIKDD